MGPFRQVLKSDIQRSVDHGSRKICDRRSVSWNCVWLHWHAIASPAQRFELEGERRPQEPNDLQQLNWNIEAKDTAVEEAEAHGNYDTPGKQPN